MMGIYSIHLQHQKVVQIFSSTPHSNARHETWSSRRVGTHFETHVVTSRCVAISKWAICRTGYCESFFFITVIPCLHRKAHVIYEPIASSS